MSRFSVFLPLCRVVFPFLMMPKIILKMSVAEHSGIEEETDEMAYTDAQDNNEVSGEATLGKRSGFPVALETPTVSDT